MAVPALDEPPRRRDDRLSFSHSGAQTVVAVDLEATAPGFSRGRAARLEAITMHPDFN